MGTIKTTMTADAQQLINEQKRVGQSAAEVNNEYREASRELAQMGRVSSQVFREMQTPADKYNQRIEALNNDLSRGKITQEQYSQAVGHVRDKFESAVEKGSKFNSVLGSVATHAAGFLSVTAAISAITESLREATQEAEDARQKLQERFVTRGELAQVYDNLGEADAVSARFRIEGGAQTRQSADAIAFALRSAGLDKDIETFLKVGGTGLVGAESMASTINAITSLQKAFNPAETGGSAQILSKGLVASGITAVAVNDILSASAAKSAAGADSLGFTDEEAIAAVATLTDPFKSVETAGERIKSLFKAIGKGKVIKDKTLSGAMTSIENKLNAGSEFKDIFGGEDEGAIEGYRMLLKNMDRFSAILPKINAANDGGVLEQKLQMIQQDPKQLALMNSLQTSGQIEVAREELAPQAAYLDALIQQADELRRRQGWPMLARMAASKFNDEPARLGLLPGFSGELINVPAEMQQAESQGQGEVVAILRRIDETQRKLTEIMAQQRSQQQQRPTVPNPDRGG